MLVYIIDPGGGSYEIPEGLPVVDQDSPQSVGLDLWYTASGGVAYDPVGKYALQEVGTRQIEASELGPVARMLSSSHGNRFVGAGGYGASDFSGSIWVRRESASNYGRLFDCEYGGTRLWDFMLAAGGGYYVFDTGSASALGYFTQAWLTWELWGFTKSGTTVKVYRNGLQLGATGTGLTADIGANTDGVGIGSQSTFAWPYIYNAVVGQISEARLYRRGLSAEDHLALWLHDTRYELRWRPSGRVYVSVTVGGGVFDETGLAVAASALTALTDLQRYRDLGAVAAVATAVLTDVERYSHLGVGVAAAGVVAAAAELQRFKELSRAVPVAGVVTGTDAQHAREVGLPVGAVLLVTATDMQHFKNAGLAVAAAAAVTEADVQRFKELAAAIGIAGGVTGTDTPIIPGQELGLPVGAVAVVTGGDAEHYKQLGLASSSAAVLAGADLEHYVENGRAVSVLAGVGAVDQFHGLGDIERPIAAVGVVAGSDFQHYKNLGGAASATAMVALASGIDTRSCWSFDGSGIAADLSPNGNDLAGHGAELYWLPGYPVVTFGRPGGGGSPDAYLESVGGISHNLPGGSASWTLMLQLSSPDFVNGRTLVVMEQAPLTLLWESDRFTLYAWTDQGTVAVEVACSPGTGLVRLAGTVNGSTLEASLRVAYQGFDSTATTAVGRALDPTDGTRTRINTPNPTYWWTGSVYGKSGTLMGVLTPAQQNAFFAGAWPMMPTDVQHYVEANRPVLATATVTATTLTHFAELGLPIIAVGVATETDARRYREEARVITASVNAAVLDLQHALERLLPVEAQAALSVTDREHYRENLALVAAATAQATDGYHWREVLLAIAATATVTGYDAPTTAWTGSPAQVFVVPYVHVFVCSTLPVFAVRRPGG